MSLNLNPRPLIRCEAGDSERNPCGVLGVEQLAQASAAGLCCRVWLRRYDPSAGGAP